MRLPLMQWTLRADRLPERLMDTPKSAAFSLPGADALKEFADLIGGDAPMESMEEGVPYTLSGLFEEDLTGKLTLSREIDFGSLCGDRALLVFSHLSGKGEICLGDQLLARFGEDRQEALRQASALTGEPCGLCVDVSEALRLGRNETLRLCFDVQRPAGAIGAIFLCVTTRANLSCVSIQPDELRRTMTVRSKICAQRTGRYVLRVQAISGEAGRMPEPAREKDIMLEEGETRGVQFGLNVDTPVFVPGKAYAAPALKIQLFAREKAARGDGVLCDETLLLCGYAGAAPRAYLPLSQADCLNDPALLCSRLASMGISAVSLPVYAPEGLYLALTRAGVAAVQFVSEEIRPRFTRYPCLTLLDAPVKEDAPSLEAAAWQMAGSVAFPRAIDPAMTAEEMLMEASGRRLDRASQGVRDALAWLRAVQIRMRAEAVRQGRYQSALCGAQEFCLNDVTDALRTAFSSVHLSALPLSGAWWTGTHFSASLEAFIHAEQDAEIQAIAALEDDDGTEFARFEASCKKSGYLGVIEASLPDTPCVLTLRCALLCKGETIEESVLPVYVGERGPLEAAF